MHYIGALCCGAIWREAMHHAGASGGVGVWRQYNTKSYKLSINMTIESKAF